MDCETSPYLEEAPGSGYLVKKEPLLPELQRYLHYDDRSGWSVRHKFVVSPGLDPDRCARVNYDYRSVKAKVEACEENLGDGNEFVFWHCRGYRFDAFRHIAKRLAPADYWRLLNQVWMDSENIHQNLTGWKRLWGAPIPQKHLVMDDGERAKLCDMAPSFKVWRGLNRRPFRRDGISWTIDKDKALWFARRYYGPGRVLHGRVKRRDVHAYLEGRGESEIVATDVQILNVETDGHAVRRLGEGSGKGRQAY